MNLLKNKTILITKSEEESRDNLDLLINQGAEIIYFPTIKIVPSPDISFLNDALKIFDQFDYIIFTSSNAVDVFAEIAKKNALSLASVKIAAVGASTAFSCQSHGIKIDLLPNKYSAAGLAEEFSKMEMDGKNIFIPSSSLSRNELKLKLSELGANVYSVPVYDVIGNEANKLILETEKINKKRPDLYIFTSPSSFNNFLKLMNLETADRFFEKSLICAIGNTTESAIRETGLSVHIVPEIFSLSGISEAVIRYFSITANIS